MKKRIVLIILVIIIAIGIVSIYRTFAYDSENNLENNLNGDINLTYSLKNEMEQNVIINSGEEKYVDMKITNIYNSSIKYGVYYQMVEPKETIEGLTLSIDSESENKEIEVLKPEESKIVSIKIVNNSQYNVSVRLGNVIGFVNGDINTLLEDNMILIH